MQGTEFYKKSVKENTMKNLVLKERKNQRQQEKENFKNEIGLEVEK